MAGRKQAPAKEEEDVAGEAEADGWDDAVVDADKEAPQVPLRMRDWRDVEKYREMKELKDLVDDESVLDEIFQPPPKPEPPAKALPKAMPKAAPGKNVAKTAAKPVPKAAPAKAPPPARPEAHKKQASSAHTKPHRHAKPARHARKPIKAKRRH